MLAKFRKKLYLCIVKEGGIKRAVRARMVAEISPKFTRDNKQIFNLKI